MHLKEPLGRTGGRGKGGWHAHDSVLRVVHEGIASGVVKLAPVPHPKLKNGTPVVVELVPVGNL